MKPHGGCFTLSSISHFENMYSYRNESWKNNTCYALYSYQVKNALCAIVCLWTPDWSALKAVSHTAFSKTLVFTKCLLPSFVADSTAVGAEGVITEFHNLRLRREAYTPWFGALSRWFCFQSAWKTGSRAVLPARITRSKWYYFLNISCFWHWCAIPLILFPTRYKVKPKVLLPILIWDRYYSIDTTNTFTKAQCVRRREIKIRLFQITAMTPKHRLNVF